jgi:hypothetical protein
MKSPLVHHVGWSQTSGHKLHATQGQYLSMYTCIIFLEYVNLHLGDFQKNEDFVTLRVKFQIGQIDIILVVK